MLRAEEPLKSGPQVGADNDRAASAAFVAAPPPVRTCVRSETTNLTWSFCSASRDERPLTGLVKKIDNDWKPQPANPRASASTSLPHDAEG